MKNDATKAYRVVGVEIHAFLAATVDASESPLPFCCQCPLNTRPGGPLSWSECLVKGKVSYRCLDSNSRSVARPDSAFYVGL